MDSVVPDDPTAFDSVRIGWAEHRQNRPARPALTAWVAGASLGPDVGHTAAMAVILVCIPVVDRAPPLRSTSVPSIHPDRVRRG